MVDEAPRLRVPSFWTCGPAVEVDLDEPPEYRHGAPPPSLTTQQQPPPSPPEQRTMRSFVEGLVSPFLNCVQPPFQACGAPMTPWNRTSVVQCLQMPLATVLFEKEQGGRTEPHDNDVLCGRGGSSIRHRGNQNFRELIAANKTIYSTLTKKQKMLVARQIVDLVHHTNPPGRFLARDNVTGLWEDIGLPRSLEKTAQALREKSSSKSGEAAENDTPTPPCSPAQSTKSSRNIEAPPIVVPAHLQHVFSPLSAATPDWPSSPHRVPQCPPTPMQLAQGSYRPTYSPSTAFTPSRQHSAPVMSSPMPSTTMRYQHTPPTTPKPHHWQPSPLSGPQGRYMSTPPRPYPSLDSIQLIEQPVLSSGGRDQTCVSPERQQEYKRQRIDSTPRRASGTGGLTAVMESRLSLQDRIIRGPPPPSSVVHCRSLTRRSFGSVSSSEDMDGLVALSTAAFLKLDETE